MIVYIELLFNQFVCIDICIAFTLVFGYSHIVSVHPQVSTENTKTM